MKKVMAVAIVFVFIFVTGVALAGEGEAKSARTKGGPALNNMANWMMSHFPHRENSAATKEATPPLSKEELRIQRENTGMGMKGRIGNE